LLDVAVDLVRKETPEARSRKTTGAYAGWISDFMWNPLNTPLDFASGFKGWKTVGP
jgi:hypothetical protein